MKGERNPKKPKRRKGKGKRERGGSTRTKLLEQPGCDGARVSSCTMSSAAQRLTKSSSRNAKFMNTLLVVVIVEEDELWQPWPPPPHSLRSITPPPRRRARCPSSLLVYESTPTRHRHAFAQTPNSSGEPPPAGSHSLTSTTSPSLLSVRASPRLLAPALPYPKRSDHVRASAIITRPCLSLSLSPQ